MRFKLIFIIVIVSNYCNVIQAQRGNTWTLMWTPEKFVEPYDLQGQAYKDLLDQRSPVANKKDVWKVYSDRDKNPSYKSPDLNAESSGTLSFLEQFFVIEEMQGWIHIVSMTKGQYPSGNQTKPGQRVVDRGWVPKDKMLLWSDGLKDFHTKIS